MTETRANVPAMTEVRITVLRCSCLDPESHHDAPCPQGSLDPTAARVVRQYRNPFRQLAWKFFRR